MKKWFSVVLIAMLSACSIQGIFEKQDVSTQFEIVKRRVIEKHKVLKAYLTVNFQDLTVHMDEHLKRLLNMAILINTLIFTTQMENYILIRC